jgi:hypothetical protein
MRRQIESPVAEISAMIAQFTLRECAFLDQLSLVRYPTACVPFRKRRHKKFVAELLSFYCCVCEDYFGLNSGDVTSLFDSIVEEAARHVLIDPFSEHPPWYQGDLRANRLERYMRRIGESRAVFGMVPPGPRVDVAAARIALELRRQLSFSVDHGDLPAIEQQLVHRLKWTANELTG